MVRLRDRYDWYLVGLVGIPLTILLLLILFTVFEYAGSEVKIQRALVVQVFYEARRSGVGVGPNGSGGVTTVVTSHGPSYSLLLEFDGGQREIVKTSKASLAAVDEGKKYKFYCRYGYFTKDILRCER